MSNSEVSLAAEEVRAIESLGISNITPAETEELLLKAANEKSLRSEDPVEYAAAMYTMYHERFTTLANKMSTKALKRVILKNVLEPLEDTGLKYQTEQEKDFGNLMNALLEAKFLMILHMGVYEQARQEQEKLEAAQVSPEQTAATEKDQSNG